MAIRYFVVLLCRPEGIATVLQIERDMFDAVRARLGELLQNQLTNFRYMYLHAVSE